MVTCQGQRSQTWRCLRSLNASCLEFNCFLEKTICIQGGRELSTYHLPPTEANKNLVPKGIRTQGLWPTLELPSSY